MAGHAGSRAAGRRGPCWCATLELEQHTHCCAAHTHRIVLPPCRDYAAARDLLVWLEQNTNFNTPLRFDQLHEDRLAAYSGIFLPGGGWVGGHTRGR
jgi:hypothetical protein